MIVGHRGVISAAERGVCTVKELDVSRTHARSPSGDTDRARDVPTIAPEREHPDGAEARQELPIRGGSRWPA